MTLTLKQRKQAFSQTRRAIAKRPMIEGDVYFRACVIRTTNLARKYWDKTVTSFGCGSFSKNLSAGLRLGWCCSGRYFAPYRNPTRLNQLWGELG